jgi:hypothetical protein
MDMLFKDIRFGARVLIKNRASSAISIIALGLGIGLTAMMFSIVWAANDADTHSQGSLDPERVERIFVVVLDAAAHALGHTGARAGTQAFDESP